MKKRNKNVVDLGTSLEYENNDILERLSMYFSPEDFVTTEEDDHQSLDLERN